MTATEAVPRAARTQKQRRTDRAAIGRLELALVIGLAIVAAVPRCINLLGLDPFIDESSWVDWATREFEPTVLASWLAPLLHDGRPPLHFWLMLPIAAVVENGFLAGRLAAALAGVASTLALYGLGREITSRTAALGAALLWALSSYTVLFARIAADDALLALVAILATWSSIVLARRPTIKSGIVLGMMLGLGALTKTTGAMFVLAPPLAILVAGHPRNWRTYVWPLATGALVSIIAVAPIVPWLPQVLAELGRHAAPAGTGGSLLTQNTQIATVWLYQFVGAGLPILAGIGLLAAVGWRQSMLLLVTLLGALWLGLLLATGTSLFARYFLFGVFPVFLLAGYTLDRLATLLGRAVGRVPSGNTSASTAARVAIVIVGVGVVLWSRADLLHDVMMDPARAAIPEGEHFRYVEQWLAVYGLGQVADELRARGHERPVTVVVPAASREERVLIPYGALRAYLRHDASVRFVEETSLYRAQDLRDLRRTARDGPTFLLVNGTYTDAPGTPNDVPAYTRRLEDRLAHDVPEAHPVLRIDRPNAPNWLTLYRLDPGD
jgi:hypothetical protein